MSDFSSCCNDSNGGVLASPPSSAPPVPGDWRRRLLELKPLEETFKSRDREFHGTQRDPLNAELRQKVEKPQQQWARALVEVRAFIDRTAPKGAVANEKALNSLRDYEFGYSCTEDLTVPPEQIAEDLDLQLPYPRLCELETSERFDIPSVESALIKLSDHKDLLPLDVLEEFRGQLLPLDRYAQCPVADTSIALHERHHMDCTEGLRAELRDGAPYMSQCEGRAQAVHETRMKSYENGDMAACAAELTDEVTLMSDLISLNKLRMDLFNSGEDDAKQYRRDVYDLCAAAAEIVLAMEAQVEKFGNGAESDLEKLLEALNTRRQLRTTDQQTAADLFREHIDGILEYNANEEKLWREIKERFASLTKLSKDRDDLVFKTMDDIHSARYKDLSHECYIDALNSYIARLGQIGGIDKEMRAACSAFTKYCEKMSRLLAEDCDMADETVLEFKMAEAAFMITRYADFASAIAEAKQKARNKIEGLQREARQRVLDEERAAQTLDSRVHEYKKVREDVEELLEATQAYVRQLEDMEKERKNEVEPTIEFAMGLVPEGGDADKKTLMIDTTPVLTGKRSAKQVPPAITADKEAAEAPKAAVLEKEKKNIRPVNLSSHPTLVAALRAYKDEQQQVEKAENYFEGEQKAVDEGLRKVRAMVNMAAQMKATH